MLFLEEKLRESFRA